MKSDSFITHSIDFYMGRPKSGKTTIAGTYPKPLLYIAIGNDGGGRVLRNVEGIIVRNIYNDAVPSLKKLYDLFDEVERECVAALSAKRQLINTCVIDTIGALQEDIRSNMEKALGRKLNMQEWGKVGDAMYEVKTRIKNLSKQFNIQFVLLTHTREQEVTENTTLEKEIHIVPDLTISTGVKYLKDASNIFYCARKTVIQPDKSKAVRFVTFVGPHPMIDTGTRDIILERGMYLENFNYDILQKLKNSETVTEANLANIINNEEDEEKGDN